MRILISAPSLEATRNVSGISTVVREMQRALEDEAEFLHLQLGSEQGGTPLQRRIRSVSKICAAATLLLKGRYDVFHSNTAMNAKSLIRDCVLAAAARTAGKPVLLHLHGGHHLQKTATPPLRWAADLLFRLAGKIVLLSATESRLFISQFPSCERKVAAIPNGIDMKAAAAHAVRRQQGQALRVVFCGRFAEEKGLAVLLQMIREGSIPGVELHFFGAGDLLPQVVAASRDYPGVVYGGTYSAADACRVLSEYDVLVLPSLGGEGMPMAMVEAMAVGVIPIATPIASIPEMIEDGVNGFIVPTGSSEAIRAVLVHLRDTQHVRQAMSARAHEDAQARFDSKRNFRKFLDLYNDLAGGSHLKSKTVSRAVD
jgi:glycosyltransferase involved in cell wall biosynthesis